MKRRTAVRLALAVLCVADAGAIGVLALSQVRTSSQSPPLTRTFDIPWDVVPDFYHFCQQAAPERGIDDSIYGASIMTDLDGIIHVEAGRVNPEDGTITVDAEYTAAINGCLAQQTVEVARSAPPTSPLSRMQMYRWAYEWQGPCLRAIGWPVQPAAYAAFMDDDNAPWDLWQGDEEQDFEELLRARLTCPPIPPFLRTSGE